MSLDAIREQIKTILSGVEGIGMVHDYTRLAVDYQKLLQLFKDTEGRINAVMFAREKLSKQKMTIGGASAERAHIFKFRAVMGLEDGKASGIIFDNLLDRIEREFEEYDDLNGACLTCMPDWGPMGGQTGMQITLIEERMFGNVLCHYAEMSLCAVEMET